MNYTLLTVPHHRQRYNTVGDWITDAQGRLVAIIVSDMGNEDYHLLGGVHELSEAYLRQKKKITMKDVDEFDIDYEEAREVGGQAKCGCKPIENSEPGFDKHAPYRNEHEFATKVEKILASKLGVDWDIYDKKINKL